VLLLVAIVAAILLTMRKRPGLKVQDISAQVACAPRGPRAARADQQPKAEPLPGDCRPVSLEHPAAPSDPPALLFAIVWRASS
jgi:hypothetical protein